jgi:hypothetical protein
MARGAFGATYLYLPWSEATPMGFLPAGELDDFAGFEFCPACDELQAA